jgi:hypothetical protein
VVKPQAAQTLLTCPLHVPVTITRVIDQDRDFLRFIESHHLKPGEAIEVEDRDAVSDSVRVRARDDQRITIGTRAASKVLVHAVSTVALLLTLAASAWAQDQPFQILDNSFLVEEAFNQEPGIFQNIVTTRRDQDNAWETAFTQEWPLVSQAHQLSFTAAVLGANSANGFGDLFLNYRWQAVVESETAPAFSPRLSLILPTGDASKDHGGGGPGWQVNLPFSKQLGSAYLHWNAGFTHTPTAESGADEHNLFTPHVAISGIWRMRPMFNLMLESVVEFEHLVESGERRRETVFTVSPGFRTGWGAGIPQTIVGLAIPITMFDGRSSAGVLGYFSYELAFNRQQP